MSELKARHAFDVYEEYTKTGDDEQAQVYLKSEVDEVISTIKAERDEYRYNLSCARNEIHNMQVSVREDVKRLADKDAEIARLKKMHLDVKDAAHVLKAFKFYLCQLTHCAYDELTAQWIIDNWEQDYKCVEDYK